MAHLTSAEVTAPHEKEDPLDEYRSDVWRTLVQSQKYRPILHFQSPQLEFRGTLVQKLREWCHNLGYEVTVLHSAVDLLDRFMDAFALQPQHLYQFALACLTIAAKSDSASRPVPSLKFLMFMTSVQIKSSEFKHMELKVCQNVQWRLLVANASSFALMLEKYLVTDEDLAAKGAVFGRRFRRRGARLLREYLDLTLSDVRLKVIPTVDVGCACVACTRLELTLTPWPAVLCKFTGKKLEDMAPVINRLLRMKNIVKSQSGVMPGSVATTSYVHNLPVPTPPATTTYVDSLSEPTPPATTNYVDNLTDPAPPATSSYVDNLSDPTPPATSSYIDNLTDPAPPATSSYVDNLSDPTPPATSSYVDNLTDPAPPATSSYVDNLSDPTPPATTSYVDSLSEPSPPATTSYVDSLSDPTPPASPGSPSVRKDAGIAPPGAIYLDLWKDTPPTSPDKDLPMHVAEVPSESNVTGICPAPTKRRRLETKGMENTAKVRRN